MKWWEWTIMLGLGVVVAAILDAACPMSLPSNPIPPVTPQDALLAVEALEARQNAKNEAIWEAIRLYHPDNDEWYEAWKSSDDVRQLPGISRKAKEN